MDTATQNVIVVGVDGSEPSRSALRWALEQAELTNSQVRAVVAWEYPAFYSWEGGPMPPDEFQDTATRSMNEVVDEVAAGSPVQVQREVVHGHSAQALLDASADARLLVVGSRGHGSFYGALLGSTSQRCAVHSSCPVVIVRQ